jgi:hypothetical protein
MTFVSRTALLALLTLTTQGAMAQSSPLGYKEKAAALQARLDLDESYNIPEIRRARAIEEIYSLVFERQLGSYFGRNALVKKVVLEDMSSQRSLSPEQLALAVALRGNTLFYPTHYDATDLIASRLEGEATTLKNLADLVRGLKAENPRLVINSENDYLTHSPNSNEGRLALLNSFDAVLTARSDILAAVKRQRRFEIVDSRERYGSNGFFMDASQKSASLVVSREGRFNESPYFNAISLERILDVGLVKGFSVKPAYFLESKVFDNGLAALLQVTSDPTLVTRLQKAGVRGFEIDDAYSHREDLFRGGILAVGTTPEQIEEVIALLFP